jgi:hypothetical protein
MATDYVSLTISIGAVLLALVSFVINYRRSRKTEQLKLRIDISSRLDDAKNKIFEIKEKLNSNTTDQQIIEGWKINLHVAFVFYLDQWNFFSYLVNSKEIHEKKILDYYKERFKEDIEYCFGENSGFLVSSFILWHGLFL